MAVLALLTDVALRLRVADALKGGSGGTLECVAQARDVRARLAVGDVRMLVVGPRDASDQPTAPLVADVNRAHPDVAVIAYCTSVIGSSDDILALARAGVHRLVVRGVDDERHAFRAALRTAEQRCTAHLVYERVRDQLPAAVAPLVALYLRSDGEPPTVAQSAALLGVHRKTLVNRLAAAGCPTPRALRTWCRLFVASRLLEQPGRTVESIADQLDFGTTTGLRNALKRYTGHGAGAVRAAGGLDHVLAHFNAACAMRRRDGQPVADPALAHVAPVARTDGDPPADSPVTATTLAADSASHGARTGQSERSRRRRDLATRVGRGVARALLLAGALSLPLGIDDLLGILQ